MKLLHHIILAHSLISISSLTLPHAFNFSLVHLESQTIETLEKHAGKLPIQTFGGEPLVIQTKLQNGSLNYSIALDYSFLFTTGASKAQKDVIVIESERSNWAIPTPRGASIRQFVLLKKLGKGRTTKNEAKYHMTFVFAREPRCNESSTEMLNVSGVEVVPEYDVFEERTRGFHFGWDNCDHTVMFTCDENRHKHHSLAKRNISWNTTGENDTDDASDRPEKVSLAHGGIRKEKHKHLDGMKKQPKGWRPIRALPGHDPEDYRDLYLDLGFHRIVRGEIQEVEEGERKVGISEKVVDEVEQQVVKELQAEEDNMKKSKGDEGGEKKKSGKGDGGSEKKKKGKEDDGGLKKKTGKDKEVEFGGKKKSGKVDYGAEKKKGSKGDEGGETKKSSAGDEGGESKKSGKEDEGGEKKKSYKVKPKPNKEKKTESSGKEEKNENINKSFLMTEMKGNEEKIKELAKMGEESDTPGRKNKAGKKKRSEQSTQKPENVVGQNETKADDDDETVVVTKEETPKNETKNKKAKKGNVGKDDSSKKSSTSKNDAEDHDGMDQAVGLKKSKKGSDKKETKSKETTQISSRRKRSANGANIRHLFKNSYANLTTGSTKVICQPCTVANLSRLNAIVLPPEGSNVTNDTELQEIAVLGSETSGVILKGWLKKIENGFEYVAAVLEAPNTSYVSDNNLNKSEIPEAIKNFAGNDTEVVDVILKGGPTVVKDVNGTTKIINTAQIISEIKDISGNDSSFLEEESWGKANATERVQVGRLIDGSPEMTTDAPGLANGDESASVQVTSLRSTEISNEAKMTESLSNVDASSVNQTQDSDITKLGAMTMAPDFERNATATQITTTETPTTPEQRLDRESLDSSADKPGGSLLGSSDGTPATTRGSLKTVASNSTKLELHSKIGPVLEGSLNLAMASGDIASSEFNESKSHNVWELIDYDDIENSATELNKSGTPLTWAKLIALGIKLSLKAQNFINERFESGFDNFGGHVATAIFGTTLNGGLFRGLGFSGQNSVSNKNILFGAFYGGRPRMFFFPMGAIIKAELKFGNGGSLQGYVHVGAMRQYDNFYIHDENTNTKNKVDPIKYFNMDGILYPNGFPHENYRLTGILCSLVEPNLIKIRGVKTLGMYDPSDAWWKYRVWMPKEFGTSVTLKNSLRWIRVKNGRLPRLNDGKVESKKSEQASFNRRAGYPTWTDISWTYDAKLGMLYSGGGGKQIYLPIGAMVRAEFKADRKNESEAPILGFYVSKKAHDYFYPDDEGNVIYGRGKIIPIGFDRKCGIPGELKKDHEFQCDTQKVKMSWETDHSLFARTWLPEGAMSIMYKLKDKNLILPKEALVKAEMIVEGKSVAGQLLVHVPDHDDQFFTMNSNKGAVSAEEGVKAKVIIGNDIELDGTCGPNNTFKPDFVKIKVIYNPQDMHWKDNTVIIEGTPVLTYQPEKGTSFLVPLMTSFRAEFKTSNVTVPGWFRCGRARSLDWFYPDNETRAEKRINTIGRLKFLGVEVPAKLSHHHQIQVKANKFKGIYNLSDSNIGNTFFVPKGSLGLIFKGGSGKHFFLKEGSPVDVQFKVYESNIPGIFTPQKVGSPDMLQLDAHTGWDAFEGVSGKVVPSFKEDSGEKVGVSGTFQGPETFHVSVKFHAVLNLSDTKTLQSIWFSRGVNFIDATDAVSNDMSLVADKQGDLNEKREISAKASKNFGIKEGHLGIVYANKDARVYFPKGVMTGIRLECTNRNMTGYFHATEPGHPDVIYEYDGNILEERVEVEGKKCQMFPLGLDPSIGIRGTLRDNGLFQVDIPKVSAMYDPSNPIWATNMFVPRGNIGTVFRKDMKSKPIFVPFGYSVRAVLQLSKLSLSVSGDFIATESIDYFYPDDEIIVTEVCNEEGTIVFDGIDTNGSEGIPGVLKLDNTFEPFSKKMNYLVDPNDQMWMSLVFASEDSLNEMTEDQVKSLQDPMKDTKWTWDIVSGVKFDIGNNRFIFHPHATMVWSEYRTGDKVIFGFHYSDMEIDRFLPDNDELIKDVLGTTGYIIPVGLDKPDWGIPASLPSSTEDGDILTVQALKNQYLLEPADSFKKNVMHVSNGAIGILFGSAVETETRQFFLHDEALYRVQFKFGNVSIPGTFFPVGPDRFDRFEPDFGFEAVAKRYHGMVGTIIPNSFTFTKYNGHFGIDALLKPGNLVAVTEEKSKVVMDSDDGIWIGKILTSHATLGILYNNLDGGKMFFLKHGTVLRAELRMDNGFVYGGFFMSNVPGVADEFQADNESELGGEVKGQLYFETENNFGIEGVLRGNSFQPLTRKVKAVFDPNDASWKGKVAVPEGNFGIVFEDSGVSRRKLFFEPNSKVRAMYKTADIAVWGFFQVSGPGHCDSFFPDNETEIIDLYMSNGTIVPEVFAKTKAAIVGTLLKGNQFLSSAKVKAYYNHKDPAWRKQVWSTVPQKPDDITERPALTANGKRIIYGYLFQGMEESPHVFIAEGDSLSGFFLPNDDCYPEVTTVAPHGVLTPTHPAGHAVFVTDTETELALVKEIKGIFMIDALGLTAGFSGLLSLIEGTTTRYSFVMDRPATEFVYILGMAEVRNIWSIYLNPKDWTFDLPEMKFAITHVAKRHAIARTRAKKKKGRSFGNDELDMDETTGGNVEPKSAKGVKIVTRKTFAFIPFNFTVIGVVITIGVDGRLTSAQAELALEKAEAPLNVIIKGDNFNAVNGSGMFLPQGFPEGDAIVGNFAFTSDFKIAIFNMTNMTSHTWNDSQNIWTPVGFKDKMESEEGYAEEAEQEAKREYFKVNPFNLKNSIVPGVYKLPQNPPRKPHNFRFGPLFQRGIPDMESNYISRDGLQHEYTHGIYIKAVESPEPIFVPDTGIRGKFTPLAVTNPMHSPVTGYYFPSRGDWEARFVFENQSLPTKVKGKFEVFDANGELSKGFFYAYIGENTLTPKGEVEIMQGWEMSDLPKLKLNDQETLKYLNTPPKLKYALIDIACGFKGVVTDSLAGSIDDPNNPLFQVYLQYKGQRDGDINPWGRVAILDPVVRDNPREKGYVVSKITKEKSMFQNVLKHFSLKRWDLPRSIYHRFSKGTKEKLEPLKLGSRVNVVNLLDFRMFLYSKYNLRRGGKLDGKNIFEYVPVQADLCLTPDILTHFKPEVLDWATRENNKKKAGATGVIETEKYTSRGFAHYANIEHETLKVFEERNIGDDFFPTWSIVTIDSKSFTLSSEERNISQIKLDYFHMTQIQDAFEAQLSGVDLGFQLIQGLSDKVSFTDAAQKFLDLMNYKRSMRKRKSLSEALAGRSASSFIAPTNTDTETETTTKAAETTTTKTTASTAPMALMKEGWKTQYKSVKPNVTLADLGQIFYGLGNCVQNQTPDKDLWEKGGPTDLIEYFLKLFRVDCQAGAREKLLALLNQGYLELDAKHRVFKIPKKAKATKVLKLTPEELEKLSVAFEFYSVTKTYHHCTRTGHGIQGDFLVQPYCTISKSMGFLTELSFYSIHRAIRVSPAHGTRLIRNLLSTLKTALTKLHQDWLALKDCRQCELDRTLTEGDKFRVVSLIEFIINGMGPVETGEKTLKTNFREFVTINVEALRERSEKFGEIYLTEGGFG